MAEPRVPLPLEELPAPPLEHFEMRRSGAKVSLRCLRCARLVDAVGVLRLDIWVVVALRHWYRECPKRGGQDG